MTHDASLKYVHVHIMQTISAPMDKQMSPRRSTSSRLPPLCLSCCYAGCISMGSRLIFTTDLLPAITATTGSAGCLPPPAQALPRSMNQR